MRWYGPNNAALTVGGDVTPEQVVQLAQIYFGSILRGPEIKNAQVKAPALTQHRYIFYEDRVRFPMLSMNFPAVPAYHPNETALDCLADIIGGGRTSVVYKNLVKTQKANSAGTNHNASELAGQFSIFIMPFSG